MRAGKQKRQPPIGKFVVRSRDYGVGQLLRFVFVRRFTVPAKLVNEFSPVRSEQPRLRIVGAALLWPHRQCRREGLRQGVFRGCDISEPRRKVSDQLATAAKGDGLRCRISSIVVSRTQHGIYLPDRLSFVCLRIGSILSSSVMLTASPGAFPIARRIAAVTGSLW